MSHQHILQMINTAVQAVNPYICTRNNLKVIKGKQLQIAQQTFDLSHGRLIIIAIGKAALPMAQAATDLLGLHIEIGISAYKKGLDPTKSLTNNDSYTFF